MKILLCARFWDMKIIQYYGLVRRGEYRQVYLCTELFHARCTQDHFLTVTSQLRSHFSGHTNKYILHLCFSSLLGSSTLISIRKYLPFQFLYSWWSIDLFEKLLFIQRVWSEQKDNGNKKKWNSVPEKEKDWKKTDLGVPKIIFTTCKFSRYSRCLTRFQQRYTCTQKTADGRLCFLQPYCFNFPSKVEEKLEGSFGSPDRLSLSSKFTWKECPTLMISLAVSGL